MAKKPFHTTGAAVGRAAARLVLFMGLLLLACFLVFAALELLPGDAVTQQLAGRATPEQMAELAGRYGLDRPFLERFCAWVAGVFHGDLGVVYGSGKSVDSVIAGPLARTAAMFGVALGLTAVLGVGLGTVAGVRPGGWVDRLASACALGLRSTPEFVVGVVLVFVFATTFKVLPAVSLIPVGGNAFQDPAIFVLPVAALVLMGAASVVRPVRAVVVRQNAQPSVEAARLAGLGEGRVLGRHVLPGCAAPIAQALASVVPYLVGGAVVIEKVFNFPGLGTLMVGAVQNREPNTLMACSLVMVGVSLAAWWLADLVGKKGTKVKRHGC